MLNRLNLLGASCPPPRSGRTFFNQTKPLFSKVFATASDAWCRERYGNSRHRAGENPGNLFTVFPAVVERP